MEFHKPVSRKNGKVIPVSMDAAFYYEKAVQSMDRFHYDKALKYFRRAAEFEPNNPVNHCNLAGLLSEMGNYEESNRILQHVLEQIDPGMTECYFYMANNFANMENYESAEKAIIHYLENDPSGHFLEESEEMMEFLSMELERAPKLTTIKSREAMFQHDRARALLEEGKFAEAARLLEKIVSQYGDFMAARNNLALAYYYMGQFDKSIQMIRQVLELEPGNLHALCNLAIFLQHFGDMEALEELVGLLVKMYPFHHDHAFKLATTMGILGQHDKAYKLFRRLLRTAEEGPDASLYHYTAVAAYNTRRYEEARRWWKQAEKWDPQSEIPKFYLNLLDCEGTGGRKPLLNYHYHLPIEEQMRTVDKPGDPIPERLRKDPLVRSSFFWALRHGDLEAKQQVLQAFALIGDDEVKEALLAFVQEKDEKDYLKKMAIFILRSLGVKEPLQAVLDGKTVVVAASPFSPNLPVWDSRWQAVMDMALQSMLERYDMVQQYDMQTLWVEFLTRVFPGVPKITKVEGWAAALEYLTAKMHRRPISYQEAASRYQVSIATVSRNVKLIDEACGLKEKMRDVFSQWAGLEKRK